MLGQMIILNSDLNSHLQNVNKREKFYPDLLLRETGEKYFENII